MIATASRPESREWCSALGANFVIDHNRELKSQIAACEVAPPRYIFCISHIETHWRNLSHLLAPQGHIGLIESTPALDLNELFNKSASIHTEYMFARSLHHTPDMIEQHRILRATSRLVDQGILRSTMTENFGTINAVNLRRAHAAIETGKTRGKIVLEGFDIV